MAESAAVDASPLILFAKAGLFELLRAAAARVVVPVPVVHEVSRTTAGDPTPAALAGATWLTVVDPGPIPRVILDLRIGAGEARVLAWAMAHIGAEAIIDDRQARRRAAALGIAVRGSIGVVLLAKQRGLIQAVMPTVERLRHAGLYISGEVLHAARELAGE